MIINLEYQNRNLEISYSDKHGNFEYVREKNTFQYYVVVFSMEGRGFKRIKRENHMFPGADLYGVYVLIEELNLHIPYRIFIKEDE